MTEKSVKTKAAWLTAWQIVRGILIVALALGVFTLLLLAPTYPIIQVVFLIVAAPFVVFFFGYMIVEAIRDQYQSNLAKLDFEREQSNG